MRTEALHTLHAQHITLFKQAEREGALRARPRAHTPHAASLITATATYGTGRLLAPLAGTITQPNASLESHIYCSSCIARCPTTQTA